MAFQRLDPYSYIIQFTKTYHASGGDISLREAACISVMADSLFLPIRPGDLLAGRLRIGEVGFSPEPLLARSVGYYYDGGRMDALASSPGLSPEQVEQLSSARRFWEGEETRRHIRHRFPAEVAEALPQDIYWEHSGAAFPLYRVVGIMMDYQKLLRLGIGGLLREVEEKGAAAGDAKAVALYAGMASVLRTLQDLCQRYAAQAMELAGEHSACAADMGRLARALQSITYAPPTCLLEAMQLCYLYALIAGALNYGRMDVYLGEFLARDLEEGVLDEGAALALLQSQWRLMAERNTVFHGRIIIGGRGRASEAAADRFALLAIEATRTVLEPEPQLSLRLYSGQNPLLLEKALDCIGEGRTYPMLYNDDVNIPSVQKTFAIPREEAEDYVMFGCGEYVINHRSFGSPNGIINLLKVLEGTLSGGQDLFAEGTIGLRDGGIENLATFEALYQAFLARTRYYVEALAQLQALEYQVVAETGSFLFMSLLYDDCVARGRGIFDGGIRYLGGTLETYGNTNTANSLYAIQQLVYQQNAISRAEVVPLMSSNFGGREDVRQQLCEAEKFGNDLPGVDSLAQRLHRDICAMIREQAERVGLHSYLAVVINNEANTILGRFTAASADGRRRGETMACANAPAPGDDVSGVTAMLHSLVKLDTDIHAGSVQNMKFSRQLWDSQRHILRAVLISYFQMGGAQAMITVLNKDDLEDALIHPENHRNLMVRIGGFSARFVTLAPDVQREVLARTLY